MFLFDVSVIHILFYLEFQVILRDTLQMVVYLELVI